LPPKYLLDQWPRLALELGRSRSACILLDFDGTLSPFAAKPHLVTIPAEAKSALIELSQDRRIRVGVISGRSLADIRQMVGVPGIYYAGNHGLELEGPDLKFAHPCAEERRGEVADFAGALTRLLSGFEGAIVEDKGLTASVHYRLVRRGEVEPLLRAVEEEARGRRGLVLRHGKRVVEIRPDIPWGKGEAAELVITIMGEGCLPVYVGDDETDEEAFRSPMIHWTVRVMDPATPTAARYWLRSVAEVHAFLGKLVSWSSAARR